MSTINIRESLRQLDDDSFCKYDLLTMYDSCPLLDEDKQEIAKLLYNKEDPEVIYQKLCTYFCDDDTSEIDAFNDFVQPGTFEIIVNECVNKLKESCSDAQYNDVANQLEVIKDGELYTTGLAPIEIETGDIEIFVDGNYDSPLAFDSTEDAVNYITDVVLNKLTSTSVDSGDDDVMVYTIYDIVEDDNNRLTAKCMNESTNDFQDIKLGKVNSQKVNELLNNMLNNPNYKITKETKDKIYRNSAPWGLAVQMTPAVDIDGTNGLLSTGDFSGDASFGESIETNFEKDDRVTDGDRQGTVLDYDTQKVLVEWDYSETDDIEWIDKSELSFVECLKESEIPMDTVKKDIQSYLNYHLGSNESASDRRLSSTSVKYKGYRISLLTDGSGYAIFDKHGEMEDHGFKSTKDAKDYIDEYNSIYKSALSNDESMHESYSGSHLRQANVDAIEYFIEFEDIYPFPKEKFLASNWKDLRDGIVMGMDDDVETAEGIMEYLQKEIDFSNKHKEIYEDDPQAELTLEIYNKVKEEYEKEISKYESISSKSTKNEGIFKSKKTKQNEYADAIKVVFGEDSNVVSNKVISATSDLLQEIADACEDKNSANNFIKVIKNAKATVNKTPHSLVKNIISLGQKYQRDSVNLEELKEFISKVGKLQNSNKDGYKAMKFLFNKVNTSLLTRLDAITKHLVNEFGLIVEMLEASYGGAFDVEDDHYFTREDIIDFGNKVCEILGEIYPDTFDISDVYIHDNNILFLEVTSKQGNEGSANFKIDMRKIKKPSDLLRFADEMAFYLRQDLEELYTDSSIFTESASLMKNKHM